MKTKPEGRALTFEDVGAMRRSLTNDLITAGWDTMVFACAPTRYIALCALAAGVASDQTREYVRKIYYSEMPVIQDPEEVK